MSGELVNSLISLVKAKTYLEIGVFQGRTFFNVEIENKTAVDPNFRFNYKEKIKDKEFYFNMTSDDYFYEMPNLLKTTYIDQIENLNYFDLIENGYIVNPASEKEIPKFLFSNIEPNINRSKSLIKLLIKKFIDNKIYKV